MASTDCDAPGSLPEPWGGSGGVSCGVSVLLALFGMMLLLLNLPQLLS